jgi:hypothetical protein
MPRHVFWAKQLPPHHDFSAVQIANCPFDRHGDSPVLPQIELSKGREGILLSEFATQDEMDEEHAMSRLDCNHFDAQWLTMPQNASQWLTMAHNVSWPMECC